MNTVAMDPIWEQQIYSQGNHLNRYPYDAVVSFLMRHRPRHKARHDTSVLEVGCGAGNNLWFAAREGFAVAGIDGSPSAIEFARARFLGEGLEGDLRLGFFTELPWLEESFDLAIDRCSLACVGGSQHREAVAEVRRVLRAGGIFFTNGYSDRHSSLSSGVSLPDGRVGDIKNGTLVGAGGLRFHRRDEIEALFADGWTILALEHLELQDVLVPQSPRHTEWRVIVRKT